jgi:hypothetical protein
MKTAFLFCAIALPIAASAQKLQATAPPTTYHVGSEKAPLYYTPADTAKKTGFYLSAGAEAIVVGEYSPRWVIVKREGFLYITPTQRLTDYNSAALEAGRAADAAGLPVDPQTKLITYQGVVEVPGVSKADLYTRAHGWVATAYRSANTVIQMQDKEAGQLVVKGLTRVTLRSLGLNADAGAVRHTLTIYVKDGRYKYVLTDLTHDGAGVPNIYAAGPLEREEGKIYSLGSATKKQWADIKRQANQDAYRLIADLQSAMTLKGKKDPSDF